MSVNRRRPMHGFFPSHRADNESLFDARELNDSTYLASRRMFARLEKKEQDSI